MSSNGKNPLIFIDTNVLLDFYRIRSKDVSMKFLEKIEEISDLIIVTDQVEMEFHKNRQTVLLSTIREIKFHIDKLKVPEILSDSSYVKDIKSLETTLGNKYKELKEEFDKILSSPSSHDEVYKSLQKLFDSNNSIALNRENDNRTDVVKLARERFTLGYPPRKKSDNSIGDAVNWEWIIKCSQETKQDVIIVTRDNDYGFHEKNESFLNDWLKLEFKERVGDEQKIELTNLLGYAFEQVEIDVSQDMKEEEDRIVSSVPLYDDRYLERFKKMSAMISEGAKNISSEDLAQQMKKITEVMEKYDFSVFERLANQTRSLSDKFEGPLKDMEDNDED